MKHIPRTIGQFKEGKPSPYWIKILHLQKFRKSKKLIRNEFRECFDGCLCSRSRRTSAAQRQSRSAALNTTSNALQSPRRSVRRSTRAFATPTTKTTARRRTTRCARRRTKTSATLMRSSSARPSTSRFAPRRTGAS